MLNVAVLVLSLIHIFSGDAALCDSARRMIPDIATVPVNKGDGNSATSLHPALAVTRIEETLRAQLAVSYTHLDVYKRQR